MRWFLFGIVILSQSSLHWMSQLAYAARPARIDSDSADLYESPKVGARSLRKLKKGQALAISNLPVEGFFKARTNDGDIGWVPADLVLIFDRDESEKKPDPFARKERPHYVRIRGFYGVTSINPSGLLTQIGIESVGLPFVYGGEIHALLPGGSMIFLRGERLDRKITVIDQVVKNTYLYTFSSIPIQAGLNLKLIDGQRLQLHLGAMGGMALNTLFSASAQGKKEPNTTTYQDRPWVISIRGDTTIRVGSYFGIFLDGGYRMMIAKSLNPTATGNGGEVLKSDGKTFVPLALDYSGWFAALGLGFQF